MRSAIILTGLALAGSAWTGDELQPDRFETLRTMIKPEAGAFDDIPWAATLWEARRKAAAEGKPLFVLSGGGPPLGAT